MNDVIISVSDISKHFRVGMQNVQILKKISFKIKTGDFCIIFGPSGCGKSTLLHTILGLEAPSAGAITFLSQNMYQNTSEDDRSEFRKVHIGMVYQQPNWIKSLTVLENIAFPLLLLGEERKQTLEKAKIILRTLEMTDWAGYNPTELSSGQQQRTALARALVKFNPDYRVALKKLGLLTRDARIKERKKYGKRKQRHQKINNPMVIGKKGNK